MSAPKFTPGPWGQYDADPLIIIKPGDGSSLGEMSAGSPQRSRGEQLANARLAAAAPELYEALRKMLAQAENFHVSTGHDEGGCVQCDALCMLIPEARAALAKAVHP